MATPLEKMINPNSTFTTQEELSEMPKYNSNTIIRINQVANPRAIEDKSFTQCLIIIKNTKDIYFRDCLFKECVINIDNPMYKDNASNIDFSMSHLTNCIIRPSNDTNVLFNESEICNCQLNTYVSYLNITNSKVIETVVDVHTEKITLRDVDFTKSILDAYCKQLSIVKNKLDNYSNVRVRRMNCDDNCIVSL